MDCSGPFAKQSNPALIVKHQNFEQHDKLHEYWQQGACRLRILEMAEGKVQVRR